jgi:threonylcarbamoyladenosine tRNA methylthiotransferase MtaB
MRRRYNAGFYRDLILKLNDEIEEIGIGVDVITGFPGERTENFENTYNFLDDLSISYLHVFSYSERRNTGAINLPDKVEITERKRRSHLLRRLSAKKRFDFYSRFINSEQDVLFETKKKDGYITGYTTNYIKVRSKEDGLENTIQSLKLTSLNGSDPMDCSLIYPVADVK